VVYQQVAHASPFLHGRLASRKMPTHLARNDPGMRYVRSRQAPMELAVAELEEQHFCKQHTEASQASIWLGEGVPLRLLAFAQACCPHYLAGSCHHSGGV
jgi:hypothetical protein